MTNERFEQMQNSELTCKESLDRRLVSPGSRLDTVGVDGHLVVLLTRHLYTPGVEGGHLLRVMVTCHVSLHWLTLPSPKSIT